MLESAVWLLDDFLEDIQLYLAWTEICSAYGNGKRRPFLTRGAVARTAG